jgi:polyphosphate glucokinase
VDLETGTFLEERFRIPTPQPATPDAVAQTIAQVAQYFEPSTTTPIGVAFPGVIQNGVVMTAANLDDAWVGTDLREIVKQHLGHEVVALNDADAAGYGEFVYGAAHQRKGTIFLATLGTGIGTALIVDGHLVHNTELGHLIIDGLDAEDFAADSARERHNLDFDEWAVHVNRYFGEIERLLWPDLIIVGGGVSKEHKSFLPQLRLRTPIMPAELFNKAGIVGAAAFAAHATP